MYLILLLFLCVSVGKTSCQNWLDVNHKSSSSFSTDLRNNERVSYEICDDITKNNYKYCNERDQIFPMHPEFPLFRLVSGFDCYRYSAKIKYKNGVMNKVAGNKVLFLDKMIYVIPFTWVNKTAKTFFFYDYTNPNYSKYVKESFALDFYYDKWLECAKKAEECCQNQMTNSNICSNGDENTCPVIWDAWSCFPLTPADEISTQDCPSYAYTSDPPCVQSGSKTCYRNGVWNNKTDYTGCQFVDMIRKRYLYHVSILALSTIVVIPAIAILCYYPSLRVTRVALHRNLLVAIFAKNIFMILSKTLVIIPAMNDTTVIDENGVGCRILAVLERIATNSMYACMLVDGFYLHKLLVRVFAKEPRQIFLYALVIVLSVAPALVWAVVKATQYDVYCWIVDDSWRQWIIDGSRYALLGVNTIFLIDILRVILWKVRDAVANSSQHTRFTLRATLVLLPLFGVQFIMMSQRPMDAPCFWDNFFYYVSYTIDGLQGVIVSLLYCYLNKEVHGLIKRTYENFKFTQERRHTINMRKNTGSTYVQSDARSSVLRKDTNTSIKSWFRKTSINPPVISDPSVPSPQT